MSKDNFRANTLEIMAPAGAHFAIIPGASPLAIKPRAVYVGGGGDLELTMDGVTLVYTNVPAGSVLAVRPTHVLAGNTTAAGIIGLV